MEAGVSMSHPLYVPDRAIVAQLRRIDPGLSVDWYEGRWVVFHDLPHAGNVDASAAALARETARDFRDGGQVVPYHACLLAAYSLIQQEKLVCVVMDFDGGYRPLDARIVEHLRRLDWQRRNWWAADYIAVARQQAAEAQAAQRRATDRIWSDLKRDTTSYVDSHHHSFSASALKRMEAA
jgi:hypothetical protein